MQQWLLSNPFYGLRDIIVAYSSLTVLYDPFLVKQHYNLHHSVFDWVKAKLSTAFDCSVVQSAPQDETILIPVCYDESFAPDLHALSANKQISIWDIIALHTSRVYRVYTIGFLPGFSYMATVDEKLVTARKASPEPVAAGSVGIAGAQTGIYPLNSPGGWHIIGRTPVKQFDADAPELVKLKAGDHVQFYGISKQEYESLKDC